MARIDPPIIDKDQVETDFDPSEIDLIVLRKPFSSFSGEFMLNWLSEYLR